MSDLGKPVNVSTVKHRSPWRFPGGKTWLVPTTRRWLASARPRTLVEPFAGGASVGLSALFDGQVERLVLVELDEDVWAAWRAVLEYSESLCSMISSFVMTEENVRATLRRPTYGHLERGFKAILRNRVQHGGIMAEGASLMKAGEDGRGLKSRWYAETLCRRIRDIGNLSHRIDALNDDGVAYMREHAQEEDTAWFIDPPYTVAGKRLYKHWEVDHADLFAATKTLRGGFLMTYDNAQEVHRLAAYWGFEARAVAMKGTRNAVMSELLVANNFIWLDPPRQEERPGWFG